MEPIDPILVVDLEATCWEGPPPPGQQCEIIEFGLALLEPNTGERSAGAGLLVKPERSRVSPFCTSLTTLTPEQVNEGLSFREACERLRAEYQSGERIWASWGDWDRKQLELQCASFGVPYPLSGHHINAKKLFASTFRLRRPVGMAAALKALGRPLHGTHHRGGDDAWNIAELLGAALYRFRPDDGWTRERLLELTAAGAETP
jgi:inhibitor of KinA sporulation pathway (predicted exonuclease)